MIRPFASAALALALLTPALAAQQSSAHDAHQSHGAAPKLEGELAEHFKGIELTEAQIRQVIDIQSRAHRTMDSLRASGRDQNDPTLKAEIKKLMDAEHAAFKALLSAAQLQVFEANMKAHHEAEARERPTATPAPTAAPASQRPVRSPLRVLQ